MPGRRIQLECDRLTVVGHDQDPSPGLIELLHVAADLF
jgi:hypothetical protein